ncbi:MFS transporter [Ancylobacter sp. MQZ15Z-1]|uniref:MFS transporter n=1 Tax=Ancylobacter mangrovi TaxID=2972472 RepID=A0A9X2PFM7_9HYPH|nr:MFS transporter [Ancylobacter mangrovi]MCS0494597.1 MFS transporter [Ancylobacter mangrovi]
MDDQPSAVPARTIWLMAATAGIVVANNYYNQPLLNDLAGTFAVTDDAASWISSLTQTGYALGLLFILPLGDQVDRRKLISVMLVLSAAMLLLFSQARNFPLLLAAGFSIGLTSIVPQILPPIVSQIVPPSSAPQAVGHVMGGLLLGIVLSRFVGGWLGALIGWRLVFALAALVMLALMVVLRRALPALKPAHGGSYLNLLSSLPKLLHRYARLRLLSLAAALQFGAFSLFWSTLTFHLADMPGHYSSKMAGSFALVGAIGVIGAMSAARITKRFSLRTVLVLSGALMAAAFPLFAAAHESLFWMVPAVVILDLGMQMSHVSSMANILVLDRGAASRLNTVYMVTRFAGGALGTVIGGLAWAHGGWLAVCAAGGLLCLVALVVNGRTGVAPAGG